MTTDDNTTISHHAGPSAWQQELEQVLHGEQPLRWSTWAAPIYTSQCLTAEGVRVAEWAVDVLQRYLGDDFLQRVVDSGVPHVLLAPSPTVSLWPLFDGRRLYADLFRLAAQIALIGEPSLAVQKHMRNVSNPPDWTHALIQLEVASLGMRDRWHAAFEKVITTNAGKPYPVDVHLDRGTEMLLLEITAWGVTEREWKADQYFDRMLTAVSGIELVHGVRVRGNVGDPVPEDIAAHWLQEIKAAAEASARDRHDRWVPGGAGGKVRVSKEELKPGETHLESGDVTTDTWARLDVRVQTKAGQTAHPGQLWIRLEDQAGLFIVTPLARMSLAERFANLAPRLRAAVESYPHVAGVILSSGRMWATNDVQDETRLLPGFDGAIALRRRLPVAHVRETHIVSRLGLGSLDEGFRAFTDWYGNEATWLDWTLERLGKPLFDALVHEPLGTAV